MKHNIDKQGVIELFLDRVMYNNAVSANPKCPSLQGVFAKGISKKNVKRVLSNINSLKDKYNMYEDGLLNDVIYYFLLAIEECGLTDVQKERLELWIDGYTEEEIAAKCGVARGVVHRNLDASCDKIMKYLKGKVV